MEKQQQYNYYASIDYTLLLLPDSPMNFIEEDFSKIKFYA